MATEKKKVTAKTKGTLLPLKWYVPDDIVTRYASNMVVQILENEFKITFFEMKPDIQSALAGESPKEVQAACVASIIINPNKIPVFIGALQKQHDLYTSITKS